jgi:hypothetical protein
MKSCVKKNRGANMKITIDDIKAAVSARIITDKQSDQIIELAKSRGAIKASFDLVHVLYYLGAIIVIGAMGLFMTLGWEQFGGTGIFLIAILYASGFTLVGWNFWSKKNLKIAGGLLITMAVSMTPLAIYGLERALHVWPMDDPGKYQNFHIWINGSWLMIELATIGVGLIALAFVRFPFITAPISVAFWYLSMDIVPLFFGKIDFDWDERRIISIGIGLIMIIVAYLVDRRTKEDFSFWGYLFGLIAFWGALSTMDSSNEIRKFLYCLLNIFLMFVSVWLERRVFIIFGGIGVFGYLSYLSYNVFEDSLIFPFILSLLGILLIISAIFYQKNENRMTAWFDAMLPGFLVRYRPKKRA